MLYKGYNDDYRVQCVGKDLNSFENRKSLKFKGERNEKLQEMSGVQDAVFVHISGFIGGARSKEGALKLAELSLQDD